MARAVRAGIAWEAVPIIAYCDTIELYSMRPQRGLRSHLETEQGRRVKFDEYRNFRGYVRGVRIIINRPTFATLRWLAATQRQYRFAITRLDIAYDFNTVSVEQAREVRSFLERHLILKWRRPGPMKRVGETLYWVDFAGKRRPNRSLALYCRDDRTVHLELRLLRGTAVRRSNCNRVSNILQLDPNRLFQRHLKLIENRSDEMKLKWIRIAVREDMRRGISKSNFHDFYRSRIRFRVSAMFDRAEMGTAQQFKDVSRLQGRIAHNLRLPTMLT